MSSRIARGRYHLARARRSLLAVAPGELAGQVVNVRVGPEQITVDGWAALPSNDIQSVFLTIDGIVRAHAELWFPTPAGSPSTVPPHAGWRAVLDRELVEVGAHSFGGLVLRGYGLTEVMDAADAMVEPLGPVGDVNFPKADDVVSGVLAVRGWFLTGRGYDTIEVRIGDGPSVRARLLCSPRPELVGQVPDPDAPLAGFEALLPLDEATALPPLDEDDGDDLLAGGGNLEVIVDMRGPRGHTRLGDRLVYHAARPRVKVRWPERADAIARRTAEAAAAYRPAGDGLNLLVCTHQLGLGGGQLYLHELLRRMLEQQPEIRMTVLSMGEGVLWDELEELGVRVHVVGQAPTSALPYEDWLNRNQTVVAGYGANAVLANTAACFWGVDLADRLGIPAVWSIHESFSPEVFMEIGFPARPDERVRTAFFEAFGKAGAVVFEADATKKLFEPLIRPGRAVRIDYGIDLERIQTFVREHPRDALREQLEIRPDQILVVCIGTYEPRKAQGLLVAAFARVVGDSSRAVLAMVGDQGGPYSEGVHALVDNFGIADRVRLIPVTPDIDDWYLAADAFILASDIESLPRSMLEAMAFGTPVIAPAVFGVPEVIEDGINGLLFDPSSVAGAAETMRRFLRLTRDERAAIGARGRATVEGTRAPDRYARDYGAVFRTLREPGEPDLAAALRRANP